MHIPRRGAPRRLWWAAAAAVAAVWLLVNYRTYTLSAVLGSSGYHDNAGVGWSATRAAAAAYNNTTKRFRQSLLAAAPIPLAGNHTSPRPSPVLSFDGDESGGRHGNGDEFPMHFFITADKRYAAAAPLQRFWLNISAAAVAMATAADVDTSPPLSATAAAPPSDTSAAESGAGSARRLPAAAAAAAHWHVLTRDAAAAAAVRRAAAAVGAAVSVYTHEQVEAIEEYAALRALTGCDASKQPCVAWHVKMLLPSLLPPSVRHVIALDMDMMARRGASLRPLWRQRAALLGGGQRCYALAPEMNVMYPYKWVNYRWYFTADAAASPQRQGFNGGLALIDLECARRMRFAKEVLRVVEASKQRAHAKEKKEKGEREGGGGGDSNRLQHNDNTSYPFPVTLWPHGPLGFCDQDLFTFTRIVQPNWYAQLSCKWNYQWCRGARGTLKLQSPSEVHHFANCCAQAEIQLEHFNCRSLMEELCGRPNSVMPKDECEVYKRWSPL